MKKNQKVIVKPNVRNHQKPNSLRVEFNDPVAASVAIAGSFNDWRPEATPMVALGNGLWVKEIILPAGTHEYLIVADGKWLPDPAARLSVANPFGGVNSLVAIPSAPVMTGPPKS